MGCCGIFLLFMGGPFLIIALLYCLANWNTPRRLCPHCGNLIIGKYRVCKKCGRESEIEGEKEKSK
jgi:predicted amidophosphoribosyltransferase